MSAIAEPVFLYVEDDPLSREIMQVLMNGAMPDARLITFETSDRFMEKMLALPTPPTVIFLDIHLEPLNGFQMLNLLRADPRYAATITIAVTASVMNEEVAQLKASGFDGAIGKPLDFDNFPTLLERIVAGEAVWHVV